MRTNPDLKVEAGTFEKIQEHKNPASVVQLVRTLSIMRVVVSSSPDRSENFLIIFQITYDSCWVIMEVWLSGSEPL